MTSRKENHPYREAGLDRVILRDIDVTRCSRCGRYRLDIRRRDALHRVIAEFLVSKTARLTGPEIRYLRRCVGCSETDLARRIGVTIGTVSRWEHGATGMRLPADRFLRTLVAAELRIHCPELECAGTAPAEDLAVSLAWSGDAWVTVV